MCWGSFNLGPWEITMRQLEFRLQNYWDNIEIRKQIYHLSHFSLSAILNSLLIVLRYIWRYGWQIREHLVSHPCFGGVRVAYLFSFPCCVFVFWFAFVLCLVCQLLSVSLDCAGFFLFPLQISHTKIWKYQRGNQNP